MPVKARESSGGNLLDACRHAFMIHPSNTDELPFVTKAIWIGYIGDLHIETADGDDVMLRAIGVGWFDKVRVKKVFASGTSADDLVGFY